MPYITSKLAASVDYAFYAKAPNGVNRVEKTITINGKADVTNKNFITVEGVITNISKNDLDELMTNPVFRNHLENGHIKIHATEGRANNFDGLEKDNSAPLTPKDYEKKNKKAPKTEAE